MTEVHDMQAAIEAVLFVSAEPVSRQRLTDMFDDGDKEQAEAALDAVLERYRGGGDGRGVMLDEAAGGVRLVTRPEVHDWLRRFFESGGHRRLSMGALETLAIVAYRQPVTGPEIQELRGVNPSGVLKTLLERRLIRIAGRKEVVGKPFLYCTTREFLVHFGLPSLKDLPPLEEFEEALAAEMGDDLLPGSDEEELLLRSAEEIEEAEAEHQAKEAEVEDELAVQAAEAEQEADEIDLDEAPADTAEEAEDAAGDGSSEERSAEEGVENDPDTDEPAADDADGEETED